MKTDAEFVAHLKQDTQDCLVCGRLLVGEWTDLNGEIRCEECGVPYQAINPKIAQSWLAEHGLTSADIKMPYCNEFDLLDLMRDYWKETGWKLPFGYYIDRSEEWMEQNRHFLDWLMTNMEKYRAEYPTSFRWDALKKRSEIKAQEGVK